MLMVANSGTAISPAELERLQPPFQRLGPERTSRGDGHGLGLSIVAAILNAHGGKLKLDALPEGGLRAGVKLASLAQPPEEPPLPAGTPSQPSAA